MVSVASEAWFLEARLQKVLALLNGDGGETRIAGGAVRNSLMGKPIGDVDLASTLVPGKVIERAEAAGIKAIPTGIEHGTVTLVVDGKPFEVTTLRRDVVTNGRHAEVAFGTDWREDAERRDLTINALYADIDGTVIDLVNGIADIETRTLRFIGDARARITEDYLRILRYFRFFAWYGSGRPDADALRAIAGARDGLKQLSAERVWAEMKKLLSADDPGRALLWMRTAGVLGLVLPESEKWGIDEVRGLVDAEKAASLEIDPLLRLAAMVPPDGPRLGAMAERLRMSKAEAMFFQTWAAAPEIAPAMAGTALDRLLYQSGKIGIVARMKIAYSILRAKSQGSVEAMQASLQLGNLLERAMKWEKPHFPIKGADVIAAGVPAGPKVGELLTALEAEWVASNFAMPNAKLQERLKILIKESVS